MVNYILIVNQGHNQFELSILFCDEKTIADMNKKFRSKDYPTDVLSFPWQDDGFGADMPVEGNKTTYLGDIAICLAVAKKQADENNTFLTEELKRLLIHGVLHLLGYDHEQSNEEKIVMEKTENILLNEVSHFKIC